MSYKVRLLDALSPVEWSQAAWRAEAGTVSLEDCDREFIRDVMLAVLPKSGLIVDAGCGTAKWPMYLRRHGYRVMGLDLSREAVAIAKQADPGMDLVIGEGRHAPFRSDAVDAVLSLGVVEHDEAGPDAGLQEIHRILKPGGLLVLDVPYNNPFRRLIANHLLDYVTRRRSRAGMKLGFVEYRFSGREVCAFLRRTGFEVLSQHPNDYRPPKSVGLWVDRQNLTFNPFAPPQPDDLFILPGRAGALAVAFTQRLPWLVAGGITVVARARK